MRPAQEAARLFCLVGGRVHQNDVAKLGQALGGAVRLDLGVGGQLWGTGRRGGVEEAGVDGIRRSILFGTRVRRKQADRVILKAARSSPKEGLKGNSSEL